MLNYFTIKRVVVAALAAGVLTASHWLVYKLGERNERQRVGLFVKSVIEDCANSSLWIRVEALRIMAKHSAHIPPEEVLSFCKSTDVVADEVDRFTVRPNRTAG